MIWRTLKLACLMSGPIWLLACVGDPAQNRAWELAGYPGLLYDIKFYYERNALEENGRCTAPLLEGVSRSEVLAEDDDRLVIGLSYRYRDFIRDEPRSPSGQLPMFRECTGFASRTFTIDKTNGGLIVAGMDGPQKLRRAPDPSAQRKLEWRTWVAASQQAAALGVTRTAERARLASNSTTSRPP